MTLNLSIASLLRILHIPLKTTRRDQENKLFSHNFVNANSANAPLQIESPPRVTDKYDHFYGIINPNSAHTVDYRIFDEKNKLNGNEDKQLIF